MRRFFTRLIEVFARFSFAPQKPTNPGDGWGTRFEVCVRQSLDHGLRPETFTPMFSPSVYWVCNLWDETEPDIAVASAQSYFTPADACESAWRQYEKTHAAGDRIIRQALGE